MISCHLRLISIYEVLFQHMHHCFDSKGADILPQQARLTAPQIKIGSYIPPSSATIPLQMLLLIQFASQLYMYAADLAAEIPALSVSTGSNASSSSSLGTADDQTMLLTKAAADNVKDKAQMMSQTIGDFRGRILASELLA